MGECAARLPGCLGVAGRAAVVVADVESLLPPMARWCAEGGATEVLSLRPKRAADGSWDIAVAGAEGPQRPAKDEAWARLRALGSCADGVGVFFRYERGLQEGLLLLGALRDALRGGGDHAPNEAAAECGADGAAGARDGAAAGGDGAQPPLSFTGQVQLGRHARSRRVQEDIARMCREHALGVAVHHCLTDRELDRTLVVTPIG
jgi:hypothetical protein